MTQTVLILGASGRFGRHAVACFGNAGWQVRLYDRSAGNMAQAASGADVIVNALNPPYPAWQATVPGITLQVIATARKTGATVIIPGNIYVYGAGSGPILKSTTTHAAQNPLGRVRIAMEQAYRDAGVKTIILRAGDFIDTQASGNWLDKIIAARIDKGALSYPGDPDVPHSWAFLPDMARAAVKLAERRQSLDRFSDIPFAGYTLSGRALAGIFTDLTGAPVRVAGMSWLPLTLLSPFWPMARHLIEMRYLWSMPHRLAGDEFDAVLPEFRHSPVSDAFAASGLVVPATKPAVKGMHKAALREG